MARLEWTRRGRWLDSRRNFEVVGPGVYDVPDEAVEEYLDHQSGGWQRPDDGDDGDDSDSADESEEDYPTTDDGEPLCTGKDDGQCSRVVDEPGGTCWQHPEDEGG